MTGALAPGDNAPYYWTRQGISLQKLQEKIAELESGGLSSIEIQEVKDAADAAAAAASTAATAAAAAQAAAAAPAVQSVSGKTGIVVLDKNDVGLSSVDNTADTAKPLSAAMTTALSGKAPTSHTHPISAIEATGTPSSGTYLRGDGSWSTPAGGGGSSELVLGPKTAAFTVAADGIDAYEVNSSTPVTVTLPGTIPSGTTKEITQVGDGQVTIAAGAGATLCVPASAGTKTAEKWATIFVRSRQSSVVSAPPATNMIMRFKADDLPGAAGTGVASWAESSGQGHPAATQAVTGNQPTVATNSGGTGHKGVAFNGSSSFLSLSGSALNVARNRSALCIFAAIAFTSAVSTGTRTLFSLSTGTGATSSRVLLGHRDSVSGFPILGGRRLDANSLASITGSGAITTIQNTVLTGRVIYSASDLFLYKDGTQVGTSTTFQTDGTSQDTASLAGVIGANLAGNGEWFQGHLLELLVYDGDDPSGTLRQNVHSYFSQLYGISVSDALPATTQWIVTGGAP